MAVLPFDHPPAARRGAIPAYLVSGFLGSGKTTLIRHLLEQPGMADTALVINEFGEVGLDQMLVQSAVENVLLMENGCVCCSIRGDLTDTIGDLFAKVATGRMPAFSRIVIETTGLADPAPIVQELTTTRGLVERIRLEKVIVTVDAVLGARQLGDTPEVAAQVAQADLLLVTKCDLVDDNAVSALVVQLQTLNPAAEIVRSSGAGFDVGDLLAPAAAPLARLPAMRCEGGELCAHAPGEPCPEHGLVVSAPASVRHHGIESWSTRHDAPLRWEDVRDWLDLLYSLRPAHLLRMKAILHLAERQAPVVIHGVGHLVDPPATLDRWPQGRPRSEIVVITRGLDPRLVGRSFEALALRGARAPARTASPFAGRDRAVPGIPLHS
ncbi:GTP-binding protein [Ancylobacter sp. MQZ15Z-1]|uniref:GTP-binding protein n=1 Tax=Ancylobacter mangrovi TaxID=2972472 RepID=A0A9X2PC92_9HYPH|nr:GTP-binding protein [Ancylobacter mangrovi]MCS0496049.1 GTP-binding protein [Ancylobacter mangrovi]